MLKKNLILLLVSALILSLQDPYFPSSRNNEVDIYYLAQLKRLGTILDSFKNSVSDHNPTPVLQKQFLSSRLAYKKLAVLTDYFNVFDTRYINGPAIDRVEEDNPDKIILPQGFQVMEQLLFGKPNQNPYSALIKETDNILSVIARLENEIDRANKFSNEQVFDAMRSALVRLITLGITGADSQMAQYSIQEASGTLDGIAAIIDIYQPDFLEKKSSGLQEIHLLINQAKQFLTKPVPFNSFDRLAFITGYADPLYTAFIHAKKELGFDLSSGIRPLHAKATSLFAEDAFNINFFAPYSNYGITETRIELGKKLFYDPILSGTKDRSCASCHKPELAFTDGLPKALAIDNKTILSRNTPTLINTAFQSRLFFDSRTDMLEKQLDEVIHNNDEMEGSLKKSAKELATSSSYKELFSQAYPDNQIPLIEYTIANAISSYMRSLVALNSRFDQYMRGNRDKLTIQEKKGFNLFMGKAKCGTCHYLPLFNGLAPPEFTETESEVLGVPQTKDKKHPVLDPDPGKYDFTKATIHKYSFKTPTLRNIELTAPYMHNGVYANLEEVMKFYNKGGGKGLKIAPPNQTLPFEKLSLSKSESRAVIAFMKSLTDTTIRQYR